MAAEPLISVVIPVYNGSAFLAESIGSIVSQTYRRLDIVVVDDGSTDDSADRIRDWAARDARIRPVFAAHGGPEHARNIGVAAALGDFIAHLDQDDIAAQSRLATQCEWLHTHHLDVCGSCTLVFGEHRYVRWVPQQAADIRREYVLRLAMIHSTSFVAAAVAKAHTFREDLTCGGEELLTRLAMRYRVGNVPQLLVKYRRHPGQRYRGVLDRWRVDSRGIHERYFLAMYAGATTEDFAALWRITQGEPFADAAEQRRAGRWMDLLSDTSDPTLKRLMTERWAAACARRPPS
jgi:glycosyltransferase involved in cell wall biosynthesis